MKYVEIVLGCLVDEITQWNYYLISFEKINHLIFKSRSERTKQGENEII